MHSIKVSDYVTIVKPEYVFLKLKPNNSIRNNGTHKIARTISSLYKNLFQIIKREEQKLVKLMGKQFFVPTKVSIHPNPKVSYYIYIEKKKVEFYFIIPKQYLSLIKEKMSDSWSNVTIQEVSELPTFDHAATKYQIYYKKEDGLSLKVDRRDNDLLESNLNVVEVLEEGDKVGIFYNFLPSTQHGWKHSYRHTIDKVKSHKPVERNKYGFAYVMKYSLSVIEGLVASISEAIAGKKSVIQDDNNILISLLERLNGSGKKVSDTTMKKGNAPVIPTEIVVFAESKDKLRERNAAISLAQSFDTLHDDNELIYKPLKKQFAITDYSTGAQRSKFSDEEAQHFLSLAGRELLERHNFIEHVETLESEVPKDLQRGIISLGKSRYRGHDTEAFMSNDENYKNLLALIVGASRSGKSTYIENICSNMVSAGECVVIFDYIQNCELSDNVAKLFPKERVLEIRFDDLNTLQGMGYNEVGYSEDTFTQYNNAKRQTTNTLTLVDAINSDEGRLSPKMARYLESASLVVFINNGSIKDVFNVLQNHIARHKFLKQVPQKQYDNLGEYMDSLRELDEYDAKTGEIIGSKTNLVIGIIDRLNILKRNSFMELMLKKDTKNNINLVEEMQKNQLITIRMPENLFTTQSEKDILSIYMLSKLFLAAQIRADLIRDKTKRTSCSIVLDELYQTSCAEKFLTTKLSQLAKFNVKPIVSCHYLSQLKHMKEEMKNGANASYVLISGCGKEAYRELRDELIPYTEEDILALPRYHALCLIRAKDSYAKFITKLPGKVENTEHRST